MRDFLRQLHDIRENPAMLPVLDLLVLDVLRQEQLIAHGIPDPFEKTKTRENEACLPQYPKIVAELDLHANPYDRLLCAIEGVFAGNIFDLGAGATTKLFAEKSPDFLAVRKELHTKRPWLVDHFDAFADRLLSGKLRYRQVLFFCDNAGSDVILGVIPFCRLLAGMGTRVVIAANRLPALNDITAAELRELLPRLQAIDPVLERLVGEGLIGMVDSGGIAPLIDLSKISDEANRAAAESDLLVLEGMGRAIETNYEARFTVDTLKIAMLKEQIVAERHGGKNFDTVVRFDPAR